ncbi:MAG: ABC transporter permease [Metamycoplasmataceae bacterium]
MFNFQELIVLTVMFFSFISLGVISSTISERVGIINLGLNGTIVIGATFYMLFASIFTDKLGAGPFDAALDSYFQIILFIISAISGLLFNLLHGFAVIKLKANQIISGVALNILAPAITILFLNIFGTNDKLPFFVKHLTAGDATNNSDLLNIFSLGVILPIIIIIGSIFVMNRTKWGLRVKSIGENPNASDAAGINVDKTKWFVIMIAGAIAGLAGAVFMTMPSAIAGSNTGITFRGNVGGFGYLAIAIMIMGKWRLGLGTISGLFFSLIFAFSTILPTIIGTQTNRLYGNLITLLPYFITLIVLMIFSKKSFAPEALGEPFDKSKR